MTRLRVFPNQLDGNEGVLHIRVKDAWETFKHIQRKHPRARVFLRPACAINDITPHDNESLKRFKELAEKHELDIVCCAGEAATIIAVVSLVVSAGMALYTYMNMPDMDSPVRSSPNNELANRTNRERINGRVPDIFGRVKALPDLVALSFSYYKDNIEVEENLMCLGRGYYQIQDVKDGNTPIETIEGAAVSFYDPGTSVIGDPIYQAGARFENKPKLTVKSSSVNGQSLEKPNEVVLNSGIYFTTGGVIKSTNSNVDFTDLFAANDSLAITYADFVQGGFGVSGAMTVNENGQVIITRNFDIPGYADYTSISITGATAYKDVTIINAETEEEEETQRIPFDLNGQYKINSIVRTVSGTNYTFRINLSGPSSINPGWNYIDDDKDLLAGIDLLNSENTMELDGFYTVDSVTEDEITLTNAAVVNSDWSKLPTIFGGSTQGMETENPIQLEKMNSQWVGWFEAELEGAEQCVFNMIMPNGISNVTNKGKFTHAYAEMEFQCEAYDKYDVKIGPTISQTAFFQDATREQIARTITVDLPANTYRVRFRAAKIRAETRNSPVHEAKLKSVYLVKEMDKLIYDHVTMVRSITLATTGALALKERELSCIATRKLYSYATGSQSSTRVPTTKFADIVCNIHVDPLIGRRALATLDVLGLYDTQAEIETYFGTTKAAEFNYTLDQFNMSYEETLNQIATTVCCKPRALGSKYYFFFERENPNSSILFNHRNKKPMSETWTRAYGKNRDFDGVEAKWIDPDDGWTEKTLKLPDDNITNPKKVDLKGVTNKYQVWFIAQRLWNKMKYHKKSVTFTGYGETELVTVDDRIAVTNDTKLYRKLTDDDYNWLNGEVVEWDNQTVRVSSPVTLDPTKNYVIHIQHINRSVETMEVSQGSNEYELILERLPIMPLITSDASAEGAKYSITIDSEVDSEAFLITEKGSPGYMESQITAMNYDSRYYSNDSDFINNLI